MKKPTIWGQGSLFAFSGIEGECTISKSLKGYLCEDVYGVTFELPVRRTLSLSLTGIRDVKHEIVASDIIASNIKNRDKSEKRISITMYKQDIVVGLCTEEVQPKIFTHQDVEEYILNEIKIQKDIDNSKIITALGIKKMRECYIYAFAVAETEADVLDKVSEGLGIDVEDTENRRMEFFEKLPYPEKLDDKVEMTMAKCYSIMKSQVYSPEGIFKSLWTTPDKLPHKRLWLWDSIFHSIGNKYISTDLALQSIMSLLDTQRDDGFIPHMSAPNESSNITQPPVIAWGLYELYKMTNDANILKDNFCALKKYLEWNINNRDINNNNLFEWFVQKESVHCRCDECGMDNSPRFDNVVEMDCIDFSCFMANEAKYMAMIAEAISLSDEALRWANYYEIVKNAINDNLWDEEDELYYDKIIPSDMYKKVKAVSSFLPIFAGVCDDEIAGKLVKRLKDNIDFGSELPVPSISLSDETFGSDMWRGPVWINYNYMIIKGLNQYGYIDLANEIREKTIKAITKWYHQDGCIYEYYDSYNLISPSKLTRKGEALKPYDFRIRTQCIRDYGWSASLFIAMVMESC